MRIIAGEKRGHYLIGPPQVDIKGLRPMPDKVRESVFNILGSWVVGKTVLDLYAGTGAVGLEALSRGASSVTFVELNKITIDVIEKNIMKLGFSAEVLQRDAKSFISDLKDKYDLIFITPPHAIIDFEVTKLAGDRINKGGIIIQESDSKEDIPEIKGLKKFDHRDYGKLKLTFFEK
ncbi:16S rRNA (guanine(966)-N(2))-methyltransferase RsmD [bacterium]|nr:16S rRNA (guanine(966)-N(2))-methyltransferase RsmD [bacterium]